MYVTTGHPSIHIAIYKGPLIIQVSGGGGGAAKSI